MLCTGMHRIVGGQAHQSRTRHMLYFQMSLQTSTAISKVQIVTGKLSRRSSTIVHLQCHVPCMIIVFGCVHSTISDR